MARAVLHALVRLCCMYSIATTYIQPRQCVAGGRAEWVIHTLSLRRKKEAAEPRSVASHVTIQRRYRTQLSVTGKQRGQSSEVPDLVTIGMP